MDTSPAAGTTPPGLHDEREIARWVRRMFDGVAPRYDLLNHVLSLNLDRYWRARTVRRLAPVLDRPGARVLDLCCGSGDLLAALAKRRRARAAAGPGGTLLGADFSHPMLLAARRKLPATPLVEADALRLPVAGRSFDLVTAAFGFRNLANYDAGLREMWRVIKPGGTLAILEFSTPPNRVFRATYDFYSAHVLPRIGAALSGAGDAYRYLPESVRKFPGPERLAGQIAAAGFRDARFELMTFGVVALHVGTR